ncbi:14281_t:CDS:2 [Entrophospora sp. SA101]|nr:14281_t:CDS:2 [Entrophospora sp. SA101]
MYGTDGNGIVHSTLTEIYGFDFIDYSSILELVHTSIYGPE